MTARRTNRFSLLFVILLGLSEAESVWCKDSWLNDWGPVHWLEELCHWAGLCDTVCYGDLGCFSNELPCHKEFFPPMRPAEIGTRFTLHTRGNRDAPATLNRTDGAERSWRRHFNAKRRTVVIIHGWGETDNKAWVKELKDALLDKADFNVITVDWEEGADELNYMKSVQNIRVVGREVAMTVGYLHTETGLDRTLVHLIGHSLGAHAAGYAGKRLRNIGRITGLDAAGPGFENTDADCRLDRSDAKFVDVIHTSSNSLLEGGAGIEQKIGHMDFYPNGGQNQPGCRWWMLGCSHARSHAYFIQSLRDTCQFPSVPCQELADFLTGKCRSCGRGDCPSMGYEAAWSRSSYGSYYLKTLRKSPYCSPKKSQLRNKFLRQGSRNEIIKTRKEKTGFSKKHRQVQG
ncbi:pancreatic lipase-related protein 2-like [Acanthaster planci]|uniref:Pancreatic lipase-related protein 2-like n=1 Tax=Acanthaster planci TaxID=133434 RepID=A0A8B7Z191_ACAPL|nr:pancreatic lipase-related protein 2-like [Acanthaster planci]